MPRISGLGLGGSGLGRSGLDINSIVQQLVSVERRPIEAARRKQVGLTARLSSFSALRGSLSGLKSALSSLRSLSSFQSKSISSSDSSTVTVTSTSSASIGTSTINQVVQRAAANKLQSRVFSSETAVVGQGKLKIKVGEGAQREITINSESETLVGVRDKINQSNSGVLASILKVNETDYKLMLEARATGGKNAIEVDVIDNDGNALDTSGLSQLRHTPSFDLPNDVSHLTETQKAQDAELIIDGVSFSRETNTVIGAIPGVTLTLFKETGPDTDITVNVFSNPSAVRGKVEAFVSSFNRVIEELNIAQSFDPETRQKGPLLGDAAARVVMQRLQSLAKTRVPGLNEAQDGLVHVGLTTAPNGTLTLDSSKLDAALLADPLAVGRIFAFVNSESDPTVTVPSSGVADLMHKAIEDLTDSKRGGISIQERGLRASIATVEKQVIRLEVGVGGFEQKTRDRFAKLEALLEQIQGNGSVISRQISQLDNIAGFLGRRGQRGGGSTSSA
jgi:flagellar hook-associated protein 2